MKKANGIQTQIAELNIQLRKECEKYLRKVLKKNNGKISLENEEGNTVSVTYDGGNHPEYASNAFSIVESVFLNDKKHICLSIEDCEEYDISRIDTDEVYGVASFIEENVNAG